MEDYNIEDNSECLNRLTQLYKDLLTLQTNDQLTQKIVDNLISKVNTILEMYKSKSRLPFYDIEKAIIKHCREDKLMQGVNIQISFASKFPNLDYSRFGVIKVNV